MTENGTLSSTADPNNPKEQHKSDSLDLSKNSDDQEFAKGVEEGETSSVRLLERVNELEATLIKAITESGTAPTDAFVRPQVEVELKPSRPIPIAGELWSMLGTIRNHSNKTIWIMKRATVLTLAPEMWGETSRRGSLYAFSLPSRARLAMR